MSLSAFVKANYGNKYRPANLRQIVLPAAAAPVVLTANAAGNTYGVWADVALLATITTDTLVVGVLLANPSATDQFTVDIGSTRVLGVAYANAAAVIAAGAAVIAAAHRAETIYEYQLDVVVVTAVGTYSNCFGIVATPLFNPVMIPSGTGIIGRCYGVTAAAVTISIRLVCLQNFS